MSQRTNAVLNPSAEVNLTGYTVIAGTTGVAALSRPVTGGAAGVAFARATWTTASTAAGAGVQYGDVPVAAGQQWSFGCSVRTSVANRVQIAIEWRTASAIVSTAIGTVTTTAAGAWKLLSAVALTVPATATVARIRAVTVAGTGYVNQAIGSTFDLDAVSAVKADGATTDLPPYGDPSTNPLWAWNGLPHASPSTLYSPTVTATPYLDAAPSPRIEVLVQDAPPGLLTIRRQSDGRTYVVRGGVSVASVGGFAVIDFEAPFGVPIAYQAEMFVNGVSVGFSPPAATSLESTDMWVHQPLDPSLAVKVDMDAEAGREVQRPSNGRVEYTEAGSVGRWIGNGRRQGLRDVELELKVDSLADADEIQAMFGTYEVDQIPVLCIRTPPGYLRIPRTLFLASPGGKEIDLNYRLGGTTIRIPLRGDEVAPPAPGLVKAFLRYEDTDQFFGTYSAIDTAYGTYLARDRDYTKAGYAG